MNAERLGYIMRRLEALNVFFSREKNPVIREHLRKEKNELLEERRYLFKQAADQALNESVRQVFKREIKRRLALGKTVKAQPIRKAPIRAAFPIGAIFETPTEPLEHYEVLNVATHLDMDGNVVYFCKITDVFTKEFWFGVQMESVLAEFERVDRIN
jgi:hypothetical protein